MRESIHFEQNIEILERFIKILEHSKNTGDRIFDVFPVVFVLTDGHGVILKANKLAQDLLSCTEEDLLGSPLADFVPVDAAEFFRSYFAGERSVSVRKLEFESKEAAYQGAERYIFWQMNRISNHNEYRTDLNIIVASDVTELRKQHNRIEAVEKDLEVSKTIQNHLLPQQSEFTGEYFRLSGFYRSAEKIGGDWWWYEPQPAGGLHLFVGDVAGHGIGSAMVTAKVASAYNVINRRSAVGTSMQSILTELNDCILSQRDSCYSLSALGIAFDAAGQKAELCFCGSNPIFILRKMGESSYYLKRGALLGGETDFCIGHEIVDFKSQDRLFAYTDGAFEFLGQDGKTFNTRRKILHLLEKYQHCDLAAACQNIASDIDGLRGQNYADDMTFVLIERV